MLLLDGNIQSTSQCRQRCMGSKIGHSNAVKRWATAMKGSIHLQGGSTMKVEYTEVLGYVVQKKATRMEFYITKMIKMRGLTVKPMEISVLLRIRTYPGTLEKHEDQTNTHEVVIISIQHPIVDWWILTVLTPMYPCWRLPTLNCTEIMEVQCTRFLFFSGDMFVRSTVYTYYILLKVFTAPKSSSCSLSCGAETGC